METQRMKFSAPKLEARYSAQKVKSGINITISDVKERKPSTTNAPQYDKLSKGEYSS